MRIGFVFVVVRYCWMEVSSGVTDRTRKPFADNVEIMVARGNGLSRSLVQYWCWRCCWRDVEESQHR